VQGEVAALAVGGVVSYLIAQYAVGTPCKMGFPKGCQPHVVTVIKLPDQFAVFATFGRPKVDAVGIPRLARGEKTFDLIKTLLCKMSDYVTTQIKHPNILYFTGFCKLYFVHRLLISSSLIRNFFIVPIISSQSA